MARFTTLLLLGEYSMVAWPWFAYGSDSCSQVHRLALRMGRSHKTRDRLILRLPLIILSAFWPLQSLVQAFKAIQQRGDRIHDRYGITKGQQLYQSVTLANFYNIPITSYYKFRLWQDYTNAQYYIHFHETVALSRWVNQGADLSALNDKLSFYKRCTAANIPTAPIMASIQAPGLEETPQRDQSIHWLNQTDFPKEDLFFKPIDAFCGKGIERWRYHPSSQRWHHKKQQFDQQELLKYQSHRVSQLSPPSSMLAQPCLKNHGDWQQFSLGGLCTLRVMTYYLGEANPQLMTATFRMPVGDKAVDNFAAGGIAAGVNGDGTMMAGTTKRVEQGLYSCHPDTGTVLEGAVLPHYDALVELALRAHRSFQEFRVVGWDMALAESGPLVLEGNVTWCVDLMQMAHRKPLGLADYPKLYLHYVDDSSTEK